ncbi:hypothetical protein EJ02DRAFT_127614 [Clathrospora elynae]|uniref:Uncharacterized protein n=1 Tax=Clathrospora elynae TaxID=706981 RepID=A0A6A5SAJ9_9PLEO|nr:hypothetical protein EJ02DRAFT_127614 [Clathrospora elynae]
MPLHQFFDPLGETEPCTTLYTLTVYKPPHLLASWIPRLVTRTPVTHPNSGATYKISPDHLNPDLDCLELKHLDDMATKIVTIKSAWFPPDMRCDHVQGGEKRCDQGCYVREKGGRVNRWTCERRDCDGHVYCGRVKLDNEGKACFGESGKRMVCLER